mmetsp:Transcript_74401/g.205344  ORF Transcript_74401/g.205344 Transcript_74401/m.205344 type:complete len:268 (+) Transcript_74401:815-1618(+)
MLHGLHDQNDPRLLRVPDRTNPDHERLAGREGGRDVAPVAGKQDEGSEEQQERERSKVQCRPRGIRGGRGRPVLPVQGHPREQPAEGPEDVQELGEVLGLRGCLQLQQSTKVGPRLRHARGAAGRQGLHVVRTLRQVRHAHADHHKDGRPVRELDVCREQQSLGDEEERERLRAGHPRQRRRLGEDGRLLQEDEPRQKPHSGEEVGEGHDHAARKGRGVEDERLLHAQDHVNRGAPASYTRGARLGRHGAEEPRAHRLRAGAYLHAP